MSIINVDVFCIQLIKSVEEWYDKNYMEIDNKKEIHVCKIKENYKLLRFKNAKNLHEEKKKFLSEIHALVWETEVLYECL